jgi:hypothetical protein
MPECYRFNSQDRELLSAAAALLKEIVAFAKLCPAKLVSIAKVQNVLSRLPRVTADLDVTISVIGPRHNFDEVETWHYWDIAIESERLSISSGGHYYCPSTGGDSFTTMNWIAVPEKPAVCEDYRERLWMVPDVQSFPEGVAAIDFASSCYKIEISDPDNVLLSENEECSDEQTADQVPSDDFTDRPPRPDLLSAAQSVQGGQITLEHDSTFRLRPNAGDYLLRIRCRDPWSTPPEFAIADFWEFRESDRLLITNREQDYPAPVEQMEEGGPNLWKALPGDRLAWVGWRLHSTEPDPTLIALINCLFEGYVYGEPVSPTLDSVLSFGAPTSEPTADVQRLWMVGYDAAVSLGLPDDWQPSE